MARILITGAAGTIGRELVRHFLAKKWQVVAHINKSTLSKQDFENSAENLEVISWNLELIGSGTTLIEAATKNGALDFVINNAANQEVISLNSRPSLQTAGASDRIMRINVSAPAEILSACAGTSVGVVVNISSIEALSPGPGHGLYGASKAALDLLTQSAAIELAPMRVLGIRLGLIGRENLEQEWPAGVKSWNEKSPLRRYGTPQEVAGIVDFMISPANAWATGSTYTFDGGMSAAPNW